MKKPRCRQHPRYRINRAPENECPECLRLYLQFKGVRRALPPPEKVFRSSKDYRRQAKFKKPLDE